MSKLQGLGIFYFAAQKFHLFIPKFFVVFRIVKTTAILHLSEIWLFNTMPLFAFLNKMFVKYFKLGTNLKKNSMSLLCQK